MLLISQVIVSGVAKFRVLHRPLRDAVACSAIHGSRPSGLMLRAQHLDALQHRRTACPQATAKLFSRASASRSLHVHPSTCSALPSGEHILMSMWLWSRQCQRLKQEHGLHITEQPRELLDRVCYAIRGCGGPADASGSLLLHA